LWKQEIWSLELLVDGIDPTVLEWVTKFSVHFISFVTFAMIPLNLKLFCHLRISRKY